MARRKRGAPKQQARRALISELQSVANVQSIAFEPHTYGYYKVGGRVSEAFKEGLKLKK